MFDFRANSPAKAALAVSLLMVTCCQTPEPPPPAPAPAPAPVATQAPPPPQTTLPPATNWIDRPQTAGTWTYSQDGNESRAFFGTPGAPLMIIRCDARSRQVGIGRITSTARRTTTAMRISAETTARDLVATPIASAQPLVGVVLDARDPLLDAMAITRGRFALEVEGEPGLYVPAWAEVTRVIEDCR